MAAAVAAARERAKVTVLEAADVLGGTTVLSGGGIWVPANPWAAALGIEDSPELALEYLSNLQAGDVDESLREAYVRTAAKVIRGIEDVTAIRWQLQPGWPDYHAEYPGGLREGRTLEMAAAPVGRDAAEIVRRDPYSAPLMSMNEEADPPDADELARREREGILPRGRGMVAALHAALRELGGVVRTGMRATRLLTSGGAVTGVEAGGETFEGQVVLTTGGFERDPQLVRTFLRGPLAAPAGPPGNRGDGLRMGMSVNAALGNMSEAWWSPAIGVPGETIEGAPFYRMVFLDGGKPGGILVDAGGRRFANEATNYNDLGRALDDFDPAAFRFRRSPSWLIADASRRAFAPLGSALPGEPDPDWLVRADTLAGLATAIGLPGDVLEATVQRFNGYAAAGHDPEFGRGSFIFDQFSSRADFGRGMFVSSKANGLAPVREAPFYAMPILRGCLGTKGGLRIDADGRVLRADGSGIIPGLYAAGNTSASPFGWAYPGPGSTIGPALVFGTMAGAAAAA